MATRKRNAAFLLMRILILNHIDRLSPRVALEIGTLVGAGHDVRICSWKRKGSVDEQPETLGGVPVVWVQEPAGKRTLALLKHLPALNRKMSRVVEATNPDVIHCTHLALLPLAARLARRHGAALVYDAYERYAIDISYNYFGPFHRLARWLIERGENHFVRRASAVLAVSSWHEILLERYRRHCPNSAVLYNVPPRAFKIDEALREELRRRVAGRPVLTFVGGLTKAKGAFTLLDIVQQLHQRVPAFVLLLVGEFFGTRTERSAFYERLETGDIRDHVLSFDWVPYEKLATYLSVADVGLVTHESEPRMAFVGKGSGRKIFTYMHAGIPMVATDFREIAQVVRETDCGLLVNMEDVSQVTAAITDLLTDKERAMALGRRGREAIEERYNWDLESRKLLATYSRVGSGD